MKELLELSFTAANVVPTVCLMLVMVYWLVFVVGLLDLNFLDVHLGDGHDVSHDIGHDGHAGKEVGKHLEVNTGESGFAAKLMAFMNLGHVPLMVVFSFFALFFWAMSILGNHYLAGGAWMLHIAVFFGAFLGAALVAKAITQPMRRLFRKFHDAEAPIELVGRICEIEVGPEARRLGQATLRIKDKNIAINVRSESGNRIPPGTNCVILEKINAEDCYIVSPLEADTSTTT